MKSFSNLNTDKINPYAGNDKVKHELFDLISETLKSNGEITGLENLVESIEDLLEREVILKKLSIVQEALKNPNSFIKEVKEDKETYVTEVRDGELVVESKKIKK